MSVIVNPSFYNITGSGMTTSAPFSATPTGGTAPYTYVWSQVSGDPSITIDSPTSSTTQFSVTLTAADYITGTFTCAVTDNLGLSATSNAVNTAFQGIF